MSKELIIKKCTKCGATVKVIEDCHCEGCGIKCCGEEMKKGKIFVKVNHVMDEEHSIEWISIVFGNKEVTTYLEPGKEAVAHCKYVPGSTIYAYCNKHGLWKKDVE